MARDRILSRELIERIASEAARAVDPIEDMRAPADYKRHLVHVLARRAITSAALACSEAEP